MRYQIGLTGMVLSDSIEYMVTVPLPFGAEGYIIIDSLYNGTSSGGLRVAPDVTPEEVATLAHEMSFKFALSSLPRGGAKSGIRLPSSADSGIKKQVLYAFGAHCHSIITSGIYYPGMDMNCSQEDLQTVYAGAGISIGNIADSSFYTGLTVEAALNAVYAFANASAPLTIAVEGFGAVASHLLQRLSPRRFKVIAISNITGAAFDPDGFSVEKLVELRSKIGDSVVKTMIHEGAVAIEPKESLMAVESDILVPSARINAIHEGNVHDIKARYVVPISNAPYAGAAASILQWRGITCLPGYVCNSGGVLGTSLQDLGWKRWLVEDFIRKNYQPFILELLERAHQNGLSPVHLAEKVAQARLELRQKSPRHDGAKIFQKLARRGLYPRFLANRSTIQEITGGVTALKIELWQHLP